jgi:TRAP-type C4-dicarboxylate transport system permease large subunit
LYGWEKFYLGQSYQKIYLKVCHHGYQNYPGGLIHVNVVGCGLFAAISGSSAATVATVGKMSIPELRKRKYPEKILLGSLAGSGTLGLLIPPSIILIIYGVTIEDSIA